MAVGSPPDRARRACRAGVRDGSGAAAERSHLLKLAAGGYTDLQDAAALLALGDHEATIRGVEAHIADVRPDIRTLWRDLLAARGR
jgi:hypothetical protein